MASRMISTRTTVTSAVRGLFKSNQSTRAEVMSLINRNS